MPRPVVSDVAEFVYSELLPVAYADEQFNWPLLHFCESFGQILSELDYIVHTGPDGKPGWSALVDPDAATANTIDYVGQLIGLRFPIGTTLLQKRNKIKDGGNLYRATPKALAGDVQQFLKNDAEVFIQERLGSAYKFGVVVFEEDFNGYLADGGFELGLDSWTKVTNAQGATDDTKLTVSWSPGMNVHSGEASMKLAFTANTSGGTSARRVVPGTFKAGGVLTVRMWVYIPAGGTTDVSYLIGTTNTPPFDSYESGLIPSVPANTWTELVLDVPFVRDVVNPIIQIGQESGIRDIYVDDVSFQYDEGQTALVQQVIKLHKFLGSKYEFYNVSIGHEWSYLVIGATGYKRNVDGYIEQIPVEFESYEMIGRIFSSYTFFEERRYEWLNYNNNFQFGDLTNWNALGLAATAFAISESWQGTPGWAARFIGTSGQYGELSNEPIFEVDDRDTYRVKYRKKVAARAGSGKVFAAIYWMDSTEVVQDITFIGDDTLQNAVGTYSYDQVLAVPAGLSITKAQFRFICDCSVGGSTITAYLDDPSFKYEGEA